MRREQKGREVTVSRQKRTFTERPKYDIQRIHPSIEGPEGALAVSDRGARRK